MKMMHVNFEFGGQTFSPSGAAEVDLSIPIAEHGGASAWYVDHMRVEIVRSNGFLGSVAEGGAVNFRNVTFNPHGNGTHTECLGHISPEAHSVNEVLIPAIMPCLLITVTPETLDGDGIISRNQLQAKCGNHWDSKKPLPPAIIVRTLPNQATKKSRNWSNSNPAYFEAAAASWLAEKGVDHWLIDLPSVDRESDGGALAAHHAYWNYPGNPRHHATITEFVYAPESLEDGRHLLNLQTAPFDLDATPSRPVIIPCIQI
jgi:kynurenine formamidase